MVRRVGSRSAAEILPVLGPAAVHQRLRAGALLLQEHPGHWAVIAARVGYIGKGIALVAVGLLFITAAVQQQAGQVTGLDGALKSLRDLPAGSVLLIGIALGFAAYGVYSFARARYARV